MDSLLSETSRAISKTRRTKKQKKTSQVGDNKNHEAIRSVYFLLVTIYYCGYNYTITRSAVTKDLDSFLKDHLEDK